MYNETVMDHFQNPRNTGEMTDPDAIRAAIELYRAKNA